MMKDLLATKLWPLRNPCGIYATGNKTNLLGCLKTRCLRYFSHLQRLSQCNFPKFFVWWIDLVCSQCGPNNPFQKCCK